ncbi:hypothetical protein E2C01_009483 [Portunus trituberculatus]|uniref:Uncharacterized protein n=1 Tax=Portunus trituberculatus TaxID=210409 RepID=A0A5B7D5X4_PORTR|nr:hypothetical protein [Portunus trituberculatus]
MTPFAGRAFCLHAGPTFTQHTSHEKKKEGRLATALWVTKPPVPPACLSPFQSLPAPATPFMCLLPSPDRASSTC